MREKLQTLPVAALREMAKAQGAKGTSVMRKAELIELLCARAGEGEKEENGASAGSSSQEVPQANASRPEEAPRVREHERSSHGQDRQRNTRQVPQREGWDRQDHGEGQRQEGVRQENRYSDQRRGGRSYDKNNQARPGTARGYASQPAQPQPVPQSASLQNGQSGGEERQLAKNDGNGLSNQDLLELDSGIEASGILEVMPDGFGFIRCENFLPGENDVYVAPSQIRRFNLKTGDIITGNRRVKSAAEKFAALLYIRTVNGYPLSAVETRPNFENLTPIFPNRRLHMETPGGHTSVAMRVLDLLAPIGKGQRGMIVSPPKAGKTTLLKQVAKAVTTNHPDMHLMILLIDERPEEVTDIKEAIVGPNVEVIYSTFDELPERHKRVSEMVIERAKRLVEHGRDVIILLDSITRLARAYNLTVAPSGRTLSGGLDPAALHMPKRFFGAARNMREGGSLTVLATALVDTGSRMDDVIYEEFKGTGNMELVLDRKLSEKRIFPAVDILKSGTRRDDLLLTREEAECVDMIRKATNSLKPEEAVEKILDLFSRTRNNREFVEMAKKIRFF